MWLDFICKAQDKSKNWWVKNCLSCSTGAHDLHSCLFEMLQQWCGSQWDMLPGNSTCPVSVIPCSLCTPNPVRNGLGLLDLASSLGLDLMTSPCPFQTYFSIIVCWAPADQTPVWVQLMCYQLFHCSVGESWDLTTTSPHLSLLSPPMERLGGVCPQQNLSHVFSFCPPDQDPRSIPSQGISKPGWGQERILPHLGVKQFA